MIKNAFIGKRPLEEKGALIERKNFYEKKRTSIKKVFIRKGAL